MSGNDSNTSETILPLTDKSRRHKNYGRTQFPSPADLGGRVVPVSRAVVLNSLCDVISGFEHLTFNYQSTAGKFFFTESDVMLQNVTFGLKNGTFDPR